MTTANTEFLSKLAEWNKLQANIKSLVAQEAEMRRSLFGSAFPQLNEGTDYFDLGNGYRLKGVQGTSYSLNNSVKEGLKTDAAVEQIEKLGPAAEVYAEKLINWKPELSVKAYKDLLLTDPLQKRIKDIIDTVLTTKPSMPTMEIVAPK
jgi:hypothetical protein